MRNIPGPHEVQFQYKILPAAAGALLAVSHITGAQTWVPDYLLAFGPMLLAAGNTIATTEPPQEMSRLEQFARTGIQQTLCTIAGYASGTGLGYMLTNM